MKHVGGQGSRQLERIDICMYVNVVVVTDNGLSNLKLVALWIRSQKTHITDRFGLV